MDRFPLTSEQCELLIGLEETGSIKELARLLRRDETSISRQIKQIAQTAPVLQKKDKRWVLSAKGRKITDWAREVMSSQKLIFQENESLRIATTREFSGKILCPNLKELLGDSNAIASVIVSDDGIEKTLLEGRADIGIDCGRPEDPALRYKSVIAEPYTVVAAPSFLKRHKIKHKDTLLQLPHLKFDRDPASGLLQLNREIENVTATFNDLGSVRSAAVAGLGWATIPRYCVVQELRKGELEEIPGWEIQPRSFGVWWVRNALSKNEWVNRTIHWLKQRTI